MMRYYVELDMGNSKIKTASQSGNFPRSYSSFSKQSGLKFSGASYLDRGISLSPESLKHNRMSCWNGYHGMERNANFYRTLVLDRSECVDSKYLNINQIS